jgi:hypothetical protein
MVQQKSPIGLYKLKNTVTSSVIEPVYSRFVVQCLNQLLYHVALFS